MKAHRLSKIPTYLCSRCSMHNHESASECLGCTWPLTLEAWVSSPHELRVISIDTSCVNQLQKEDSLNLMEKWEREGLIHLQKGDELLKELKGPPRIEKARRIKPQPTSYFPLDLSVLGGSDFLAVQDDMGEGIGKILFPGVKELNAGQQSDVNHLRQHVMAGGDVFVTTDTSDFIKGKKQATLRRYGIWVFEPAELVDLLLKKYDWFKPTT